VNLCDFCFFQVHRETDRFFETVGVHLAQSNSGLFHYLRAALVVFQLFIDTQNRLVTLHSVLIKVHEETDISPHSVIYRPIGSTMQFVTKLSSPNFAMLQGHRYLEPSILGVIETLRVNSQHPNAQPLHTSKSVQNCADMITQMRIK
jgi:hypothetical protein